MCMVTRHQRSWNSKKPPISMTKTCTVTRPIALDKTLNRPVWHLSPRHHTCWDIPIRPSRRPQRLWRTPKKINHVNTTAYVCYYCQTKIDYFRRDLDAATESTARLLALANEHGLALWHAYASVQAGWVASMQGDHKKGVELARAGLAELAATGTSLDQPFAMAQLGEVFDNRRAGSGSAQSAG